MHTTNATPISVIKRDNKTIQPFAADKIKNAVKQAFGDIDQPVAEDTLSLVVAAVTRDLAANSTLPVSVEQIQDCVERSLMDLGFYDAARAYVIYREDRKKARETRKTPDINAIADYIHPGKYARYQEALGRRELFAETTDRVLDMHLRKYAAYPEFCEELRWAFGLVKEKRVLPSMRSMQFGGLAMEVNNARGYNCSFTAIDRTRAFAEALFLLLSGTGVGFSVQQDHVDKLPSLKFINKKNVVHHTIADNIEGWADALDRLIMSYVKGYYVEFNYSKIRDAGTPLKTSGGVAPGHMGLKISLENIRNILEDAQGRKLRPIEVHDIMCHAAAAVLSGGIRRSAMISLFSLEDSEMMNAKTGKWYEKHPWRAYANNSVVLKRDEVKKKQFKRIFQMTKEFGEPGFLFTDNFEYGTNPCGEIALNYQLTVDDNVLAMAAKREQVGKRHPKLKSGDTYSGWQMCNLCEINAAKLTSLEDYKEAARAATVIGTAQAGYTELPYLGWASELIVEREALLGIGMTGIMDAPEVALNADNQREVAKLCVDVNRKWAEVIGIQPAARVTCVKPSGTTSLALGCTGSGIHPHHARRYFRRVTANELEPVFQFFKSKNPHMCVKKPNGDWVIEFPVSAPDDAVLSDDLTAIQFLDKVKSTQLNWVISGTARPESSPGANHNVSNTVLVGEHEWDEVSEYLWENRTLFTGVSLLPRTGDKIYAFAPREAVTTEADEAKWNYLIENYTPVDYTQMLEAKDGTDLSGELACAGGACEV